MAEQPLVVQPAELQFPFEPNKQVSCSLKLVNTAEHSVAFKVKTTSPKKYCVRPNTGLVQPRSYVEVIVTMQAQREREAECRDKFLIQSVAAPTDCDCVTSEMFSASSGIQELKLKVAYVSPQESLVGTKGMLGMRTKIQEVNAALTSLAEERSAAILLTQRLQQELARLGNVRNNRREAGFSLLIVFLVGLMGVLIGHLLS